MDGSDAAPPESLVSDSDAAEDPRPWQGVLTDAAAPLVAAERRLVREVDRVATGARKVLDVSPPGRSRRRRARARQPLPNLFELHPELQRAARRELGMRTVPVAEILGTAVEGPAQRGGDFLPIRRLRGTDWEARWQRINRAIEELVTLPPVELIKAADGYWVVDGHNRVAAAIRHEQVEVDARVIEYRVPGTSSAERPTAVAAVLGGTQALRAAGQGRPSRTSASVERADQVGELGPSILAAATPGSILREQAADAQESQHTHQREERARAHDVEHGDVHQADQAAP